MTTKVYYTHDNGGRAFKVKIYKNVYESEDDLVIVKSLNKTKVFPNVKKTFVGKSPHNRMTKFSGGHGKKFDGNSILLNIKDNKYVFIGVDMYSFESYNTIETFISPVGNNDVVYPYAIDVDNNVYLLIDDVVIQNDDIIKYLKNNMNDPYNYYYYINRNRITDYTVDDSLQKANHNFKWNNKKIEEFYIDDKKTVLINIENPEKYYDYITSDHSDSDSGSEYSESEESPISEESKASQEDIVNKKLFIKFENENAKIEISKDDFVDIIKQFRTYMGYKPFLNKNLIYSSRST